MEYKKLTNNGFRNMFRNFKIVIYEVANTISQPDTLLAQEKNFTRKVAGTKCIVN